ncbi:MAG: hypothetical protein Q8922_12265 [Bacteroidota bacterium]|nr:hypothetical protein [Bacteroidota bacterium]MDP4233710.1 hypothetical protein [Bacteroidota bacterium]MDP4242349.1 hypothetical protein [Bacteroidota bacterium]MDP4288698.1 hypothetical protein [Bacteroidota bacterium]
MRTPYNIRLLTFLLLIGLLGCAPKTTPVHLADSTATTNAVREIQGKQMRTFRGPADILGDTTKNRRNRPLKP